MHVSQPPKSNLNFSQIQSMANPDLTGLSEMFGENGPQINVFNTD